MNSSNIVASAFDDAYIWPFAVSIHSALQSTEADFGVIVANLNNLLSPEGIQDTEELLDGLSLPYEIKAISLDKENFQKYQWNLTVYARLALLGKLDRRFLWLDADTVLLNHWSKIFEIGREALEDERLIACAVRDRPETRTRLESEGKNEAYKRAGGDYFNAGVMFLDPTRWQLAGFSQQWLEIDSQKITLGFEYQDQDILNFLLADRTYMLPGEFNRISTERLDGNERIIHYAGSPKPWRLDSKGLAFHVATEALNARGEAVIPGHVGTKWTSLPPYFMAESALLSTLKDFGKGNLVERLLIRRRENLKRDSRLVLFKLRLLQLLSQPIR